MSAFKDQLTKDLDTFVNPDEFSDVHTINGVPVNVVMDNDELQQRSDKSGLNLGELLIFVRADELTAKGIAEPTAGRDLRFDGKIMYYATVLKDCGLYEITLTQNRSM